MKKITWKKVAIMVVAVFALWNTVWFGYCYFKYSPYTEKVPMNEEFDTYFKQEDGFSYSVKKPDYLRFEGNLAISDYEDTTSLIIWPLVTGGYEYGFMLHEDNQQYEFYVDEELKPIDSSDDFAIQKINQYKPELEALLDKADQMWSLQ